MNEEGFEIPFALHVDDPSTGTHVAQRLQDPTRLLGDLSEEAHYMWSTDKPINNSAGMQSK